MPASAACAAEAEEAEDDDDPPAADRAAASQAGRRRYVALASASYAIRFTGLAAWFPYLFLWLEDIGFTVGQRGVAGTVYHLGRLASQFLWGPLADWSGRHLLVFHTSVVLNCLALGLLPVVRSSFLLEVGCLLLSGLTEPASLLDAITIRSLNHVGHASDVSRARSFGSLAWVLASPLFGYLARAYGVALLLYLCLPILAGAMPIVHLFPVAEAYAAPKAPIAGRDISVGRCSGRWAALCSGTLAVRLFLVMMCGLHMGIAFSYGFIYFESRGAPGLLLGLCLTLQAAVEVPLFMVADRLVQYMGMTQALFASMLLVAARFAGYMVVPNVWLVLLPEVLHGVVYTITFTSMAYIAEEGTPHGLQATLMGVASGMRVLGQVAANSLWVAVVAAVGLRDSFWAAAALFLLVGAAGAVGGGARAVRRRRAAGAGEAFRSLGPGEEEAEGRPPFRSRHGSKEPWARFHQNLWPPTEQRLKKW